MVKLLTKWLFVIWLVGAVLMRKLLPSLSQNIRDPVEVIWMVAPIVVLFGGAALLLLLPLISVTTSKVLRGQPLAFGEVLFDNLVIRVDAGKAPIFVAPPADLREYRLSDIEAQSGELRHSVVYESPTILRAVADWIENTERRSA
jgi:hypothetical protein